MLTLKLAIVAFRVLRLQTTHKFCTLGNLAQEVGWKHGDTVAALEEKRISRSGDYYKLKKKGVQVCIHPTSYKPHPIFYHPHTQLNSRGIYQTNIQNDFKTLSVGCLRNRIALFDFCD